MIQKKHYAITSFLSFFFTLFYTDIFASANGVPTSPKDLGEYAAGVVASVITALLLKILHAKFPGLFKASESKNKRRKNNE